MTVHPTETTYVGLFGTLCKYVPLFDANAPAGWTVAYRSYGRTAWYHPRSEVTIEVEKGPDGWTVRVVNRSEGMSYRALPKNASRWKAFEVVRAFFDGEPLMIAAQKEHEEGLLMIDEVEE